METKAHPNPNGCLARALPDEPFFVLLARDQTAPATIRWWSDARAQLGVEGERKQDAEQLSEALDTAVAMELWRLQNDGTWREEIDDRTEGMARTIASVVSPDENVDNIWRAWIGEARAALAFADETHNG